MKYYIQYLGGYSGDSVIWWRPNSSGYTTKLDEAGLYDEARAREIEAMRGKEKAWPQDVVERAATRTVLAGDLHGKF